MNTAPFSSLKFSPNPTTFTLLFTIFLGIIAGMVTAAQTAVNGEMSRLLNSATHSTAVSMLGGMLSIIGIVLFYERSLSHLRLAFGKDRPYWIWFGGVLGAFYVSIGACLVHYVGKVALWY